MLALLAISLILSGWSTPLQNGRQITVERRTFDCFVREARRLPRPRGNLFYLDLRRCPAKLRDMDSLHSFPDLRTETTSSGKPVVGLILMTPIDLACLQDQRQLAVIRKRVDSERDRIDLDRCSQP